MSAASPASKPARKLNPTLMKPIQPDAVLGVIVGTNPLPHSEMTKKLWDDIKKNNLQDAKKRSSLRWARSRAWINKAPTLFRG